MAEGGWEMRQRRLRSRRGSHATGALADKNQTLDLQGSDTLKGFSVGGAEEDKKKKSNKQAFQEGILAIVSNWRKVLFKNVSCLNYLNRMGLTIPRRFLLQFRLQQYQRKSYC